MPRKLKTDQLNRLTISQYHEVKKFPLIVILDNVRSLYNVGSFFRTCDAFRIQSLFLCGITGTPPHKEIAKTAIGAEHSVDWHYYSNTKDAVEYCKSQYFKIYAIEQSEESLTLQNMNWNKEPIALIFGNEIDGVDNEVLSLCDGYFEIPQTGTKHSLNVSVAAGVVLWEMVRNHINEWK